MTSYRTLHVKRKSYCIPLKHMAKVTGIVQPHRFRHGNINCYSCWRCWFFGFHHNNTIIPFSILQIRAKVKIHKCLTILRYSIYITWLSVNRRKSLEIATHTSFTSRYNDSTAGSCHIFSRCCTANCSCFFTRKLQWNNHFLYVCKLRLWRVLAGQSYNIGCTLSMSWCNIKGLLVKY